MGKKKTSAPAPVPAPTPTPTGPPPVNEEIMSGYRDFAQTGGFSPEALANMRARSMSPIRAVYQNALQNVNRQRALQGGYAPNYGALTARLAREQSMGQADTAINTEANLAEMVQKGRLAGLGGMLDASQSGGGGGGGGAPETPEVPKKKSKWSILGKVAKIAAPIALAYFTGGAGNAIMAGVGGAAAAKGSKGKGIGTNTSKYLLR